MSRTIIKNALLVTMNPQREIFRGEVLIDRDRIAGIFPETQEQSQRRQPSPASERVIDAGGCALLPGFVQAHIHLCQTLFRNHAEDLKLLDWLQQRIWPFEAAHNAESMAISAELGIAELLAGGTTTLLDMGSVHHYDQVFETAEKLGIRMAGGKCMMDTGNGVSDGLRETTADSIAESLQLKKQWHQSANGRLRYAFAPRFVLSCTEKLLREVAGLSRDDHCLLHTHAAESAQEEEILRKEKNLNTIPFFKTLGIAGEHCCFAHGVQADGNARRQLAQDDTRICHCPGSNMKLASGMAPIVELLAAGVNVGLGADGAPCNNNLDIFKEMQLAGLIQKLRHGETALPAQKIVEMATIDGARCLNWHDEIGSLEVGKKADLILLDLRKIHSGPTFSQNPYAQIVYAAKSGDVKLAMIDGEICYQDGQHAQIDIERTLVRAEEELTLLLNRVDL